MSSSEFSIIFVAALALTVMVRFWLAVRQISHVRNHRDAVPPAFAERIDRSAHQRAADYTVARVRFGLVDLLVSAGWLLLLTLGGVLQAIHDGLGVLGAPGSISHGTAFLAAVAVLGWLIDLPFTLYRTFGIEARFGFNRMTFGLLVSDTLKEALLAALVGIPVIAAVLWLMTRMGAMWWLHVWGFWLLFNLLVLLIWPTFIAPLFNRFAPLENPELRQRVESLLTRCGFRVSGLFVMDGSRRSAHGNAYFTGFGASKRIVFFDTLLEKLAPSEIEAVLAHELGHFRHRHVWKRLAVMSLMSLLLLALLGWLATQPWFFAGLGMSSIDMASALALFALTMPVFMFPLGPLMSFWSRVHEYEADAYASRQTSAGDLVSALVKLYRDNASTLTPDPVYSRFYDSHPPAALRVARLQAQASL